VHGYRCTTASFDCACIIGAVDNGDIIMQVRKLLSIPLMQFVSCFYVSGEGEGVGSGHLELCSGDSQV
jgi:hypothetical protein